jgi:hypothetical protein
MSQNENNQVTVNVTQRRKRRPKENLGTYYGVVNLITGTFFRNYLLKFKVNCMYKQELIQLRSSMWLVLLWLASGHAFTVTEYSPTTVR